MIPFTASISPVVVLADLCVGAWGVGVCGFQDLAEHFDRVDILVLESQDEAQVLNELETFLKNWSKLESDMDISMEELKWDVESEKANLLRHPFVDLLPKLDVC